MFPFPEIGRTLVTNTVAGARAMVARAESYERVRTWATAEVLYRVAAFAATNREEQADARVRSSAYAIRASRPGCPRKACSRPPTSPNQREGPYRDVISCVLEPLTADYVRNGVERDGAALEQPKPTLDLEAPDAPTAPSRCGVTRPAATARSSRGPRSQDPPVSAAGLSPRGTPVRSLRRRHTSSRSRPSSGRRSRPDRGSAASRAAAR